MSREELRAGARKAADYVKDATKRVVELHNMAEEVVRAALIHKEAQEEAAELNLAPKWDFLPPFPLLIFIFNAPLLCKLY